MTENREMHAHEEATAEVTRLASRLGIPFTSEQIVYVAGCVEALRVSASRVRRQQRNDEPAFGYRTPLDLARER